MSLHIFPWDLVLYLDIIGWIDIQCVEQLASREVIGDVVGAEQQAEATPSKTFSCIYYIADELGI